MDNEIIKYLFSHQYNIRKVTDEEQAFVKRYKSVFTPIPEDDNIKSLFVLKYPGIVYKDLATVTKYMEKIYKIYDNDFTPPRGYVDKSSTIIVGIAPGSPSLFIPESTLLYGNTSKTLHSWLNFDYRWYFTNICKEYFFKNIYNKGQVDEAYPDILKELQFFKKQKVIFLGQYDVYDRLVRDLEIKDYIKVTHPAAARYMPLEKINGIKESIKQFVGVKYDRL